MKNLQKHLRVAFVALGLIALAGCAGDPAPTVSNTEARPAVTAKGVSIPDEYIDAILAGQHAEGMPEDQKEKDNIRKNIRRELAVRALLEHDAIKAGFDKRPNTRVKQDLARQEVLIQDYMQDWTKTNVPTDDEMKIEYDKLISAVSGQKEYHVRHILFKTEKEASATIAKLGRGTKFAELARKSLDPGSKNNGGDLGWTSPAMFVPAFSKAMTQLAKGKYTTSPVKTEYGYHVILLEDMREVQAPSFEEFKPELQQRLQQIKLQEYIEQLKKNAGEQDADKQNVEGQDAVEPDQQNAEGLDAVEPDQQNAEGLDAIEPLQQNAEGQEANEPLQQNADAK